MRVEAINPFKTELILKHGECGLDPPEIELLIEATIEIVPQDKRQ